MTMSVYSLQFAIYFFFILSQNADRFSQLPKIREYTSSHTDKRCNQKDHTEAFLEIPCWPKIEDVLVPISWLI
jgi:hypothetical protein